MESFENNSWLSFIKENYQPNSEEQSIHFNSVQQFFVVVVGEPNNGKRNLIRRLQGQWNRSVKENELDLEGPLGFTYITPPQENSLLYHSSTVHNSKHIGVMVIDNLDLCSLLFIPLQQPQTKFILLFTIDITKPFEVVATLEKCSRTLLKNLETCLHNLLEIVVVITKADAIDEVAEDFEHYDICFNTSALDIQDGAYVKLNRKTHFVNLIQFQLRQFCSSLQASLFYTSAHKDVHCNELRNYLFHICYQFPFSLPDIRPHSMPIILKKTDTEQLRKELKTDAVLSDSQREAFKLEQFKHIIQNLTSNSGSNTTATNNEEDMIVKAEDFQQFLKRNYTLIKTGLTLPKTLPITSLSSFSNNDHSTSPLKTNSATNSSVSTPTANRELTTLTPRGTGSATTKMTSANSAEDFFQKMNTKLKERKKNTFVATSSSSTNSPNK